MPQLYADILLPIARDTFTFAVDGTLAGDIREGFGVEITLGARKRYMGIVWNLHTDDPDFKKIKSIDRIAMYEVLVTPVQKKFWEWISGYYMCTLGEVMRAALPASLKPSGLTSEEFSDDSYKPRTIRHISLPDTLRSEGAVEEALQSLSRTKAQLAAFTEICGRLLEKSGMAIPCGDLSSLPESVFGKDVPRREITAGDAILRKLYDRGIISESYREAQETGVFRNQCFKLPTLTGHQQTAYGLIQKTFAEGNPVVLHGITGSGKTEIYTHLIERTIAQGKSVLYLMPEIVMTSQIIRRIGDIFGERVTVYHSMLTDRRRAETYRKLNRSPGGDIVMGVRSSIFLPIHNIGLVIVDEEHDQSYKQSETAPRYSARDSAVVLARLHSADTVLGSATPSIESYVNTLSGKYGIAVLNERYGEGGLPHIVVSDTLRSVKRGERKSHFNKEFRDRLEGTLAEGRQAIVFQNRRGYSPYVECRSCGWVAHCPQCSVTLTYHKHDNRLKCHWCGYSEVMPPVCPSCRKPDIHTGGFGTEKIDEELQRLYPEARIVRLDRDTATSPKRYGEIVKAFESGEYDIMVGTQIVTKGFDFANVSLVGILNADNLLNYPDFRASERAYQLMTQVAGRAGRSESRGEVVIQTTQPDNPVIGFVRNSDYAGMVRNQLAERKAFNYPPYGRLINIRLSHSDITLVSEAADKLAAELKKIMNKRLFGPHPPVVDKVSNVHILDILLKCETGVSYSGIKHLLAERLSTFRRDAKFRNVGIAVNVDPQ